MAHVYRLAADAVVLVHGVFALSVVLGLVLILVGWFRKWDWIRNIPIRLIHLGMISIVVLESWLGITCPLTTWEQQLRAAAGEASYQGDFIANLVHQTLFAYGDTAPWMFTASYTAFGFLVLATLLLAPPTYAPRPASTPCDTHANTA
ncbi:MAG: DUF2784 domain-containing protein [Planctomycetaceae bacterium]